MPDPGQPPAEHSKRLLPSPSRAAPVFPFRQSLADRFAAYPLISMLILSPMLTAALMIAGAGVACLLIALPRVWMTTPTGVYPELRVSLMNLAQAWVVRRAADQACASGQEGKAWALWESALRANPADVRVLRKALRCASRIGTSNRTMTEQSVRWSLWLLHLSCTNRDDVTLVTGVLDSVKAAHQLVDLLQPFGTQLGSTEESAYEKALFVTGHFDEFNTRWEQFGRRLTNDIELAGCRAAYLAGWGPPEAADAATQRISEAVDSRGHSAFPLRLQLLVCAKRRDAARYREALECLEREDQDRLEEHAGYWRLLAATGDTATAQYLAETCRKALTTALELAQMSEALVAIGLREEAIRLLRRQAPRLGDEESAAAAEMWLLYADLLIKAGRWDELQMLGVQMRALTNAGHQLEGFSHFVEGKGLQATGRADEARAAFTRSAELPFPTPRSARLAAAELEEAGYSELAVRILTPLERTLANDAGYWQALFTAAFAAKADGIVLLRAAARAYQLESHDPVAAGNYAVALLINRQLPGQAVALTIEPLRRTPHAVGPKINHALALVMNSRLDEADALLRTLEPSGLEEPARTSFHLCAFELHLRQKRISQCREDLPQIRWHLLFPEQRQWLHEAVRTLPTR